MIGSVGINSYSTTTMPPPRPRIEPDSTQMTEDLLAAADSDEDGAISEAEFSTLLESNSDADSETIASLFSEMDSDSDGSASSSEIDAAVSSLIQQVQQQGAEGNRPPPPPGSQPPPPPNSEEHISSGDSDGDGSLNLDEFTEMLGGTESSSRLVDMFEQADADADGDDQVTEEELQAAMESHSPASNGPPSNEEQISHLVNSLVDKYQSSSSSASNSSSLSATA